MRAIGEFFGDPPTPPAGSRGGRPTVEGSADQVRAFVLNGGRLSFSFGTIRPIWGEVFAHAMHAVERGRACRCPVMSSATVSGNNVVVAFDSLPPLVIDPTFCKVRPDCGFAVNQGAIAVTGAQQTGQRQIAVSCASNPAGTSIEYAWREQDAQDVVDEWPICTGAIRDAWSVTSLFDPCGKPLVRAALGYQLTL